MPVAFATWSSSSAVGQSAEFDVSVRHELPLRVPNPMALRCSTICGLECGLLEGLSSQAMLCRSCIMCSGDENYGGRVALGDTVCQLHPDGLAAAAANSRSAIQSPGSRVTISLGIAGFGQIRWPIRYSPRAAPGGPLADGVTDAGGPIRGKAVLRMWR